MSKKTTLIDFIRGPIYDFFVSQTYFDLTRKGFGKGVWLYGERGHGIVGRLEFYQEQLAVKDGKYIGKALEYILKKDLKGHWDCYCGSGKRLRDCHYINLQVIRDFVPRKVVVDFLAETRKQVY